MNPNLRSTTCFRRTVASALILAGALLNHNASAEEAMFKTKAYPGGLRISPEVQSISVTGNLATVSWYGLRAGYALQTSKSPDGPWSKCGSVIAVQYETNLTAKVSDNAAAFRLKADNQFLGTGACADCHPGTFASWTLTPHARALGSLEALNLPPSVMQGCLPCHTIGYGQPTGFISAEVTGNLADVGCENCHGAGGAHVKGPKSVMLPAVTIAAQVCGGCHTDAHHPTYDEWLESGHSQVTGELGEEFEVPGYAGESRQMACGACHSGAVRLAMLKTWAATGGATNSPVDLPAPEDAGTYAVTCVVCHDPHVPGVNASLRNPISSTNFYSYPTTTYPVTNSSGQVTWMNDNFAKNYNPKIQICAQCHNMRGGVWTSTSRPPHHSPQYNIFIGQGGYPNTNGLTTAVTHRHLTKNPEQCVRCHMYAESKENPSEEDPNYTGHKFEVYYTGCVASGCHPSTNNAMQLTAWMREEVEDTESQIVGLMQQWSLTKAPAIDPAFVKYGVNAWEYTVAGQLSNPDGVSTIVGPPSNLQSKIPSDIKQARFNLYLVEHDASYGVHNPNYARVLLEDAKNRVNRQLR